MNGLSTEEEKLVITRMESSLLPEYEELQKLKRKSNTFHFKC